MTMKTILKGIGKVVKVAMKIAPKRNVKAY